MKNLTLTSFTALALVFAAATCNAQDRDRPQAMTAHTEGMHRGPDGHRAELDRDHRRRPAVIVVGVPIFVGPAYAPYFPASVPGYGDQAALSSYQTIDGFWYYCPDPAGYFPDVAECPNGWRLVP
jgi:hypothetical protein